MRTAKLSDGIIAISIQNPVVKILRFFDRSGLVFEAAIYPPRCAPTIAVKAVSSLFAMNSFSRRERKPKAGAGIAGKKSPFDDFWQVAQGKNMAVRICDIIFKNSALAFGEFFIVVEQHNLKTRLVALNGIIQTATLARPIASKKRTHQSG